MMKLAVCILIATVLLGLVACSDNSGPLDSSQEEGLENITWILDSYGEQDDLQSVLEGTEITVVFEENGGVVRGSLVATIMVENTISKRIRSQFLI